MYGGVKISRAISKIENGFLINDKFCEDSISRNVRQNFIISDDWDIESRPEGLIFQIKMAFVGK